MVSVDTTTIDTPVTTPSDTIQTIGHTYFTLDTICDTPISPTFHSSSRPASPLLSTAVQARLDSLSIFHSLHTRTMPASATLSAAPRRPTAKPMQHSLQSSSDDSSNSNDSSHSDNSSHSTSDFEHARCSRCQKTPSVDVARGGSNMIQYGLNLWYCSRCARLVGMVVDR